MQGSGSAVALQRRVLLHQREALRMAGELPGALGAVQEAALLLTHHPSPSQCHLRPLLLPPNLEEERSALVATRLSTLLRRARARIILSITSIASCARRATRHWIVPTRYVFVCIYVLCVCMSRRMECEYVHICVFMYMYICICIYMYKCICTYICTHNHMYTYIHTHIYIHVYIHAPPINRHTHVQITYIQSIDCPVWQLDMYVHVYVCIYLSTPHTCI